jgi:hypothetical protein
LPDRLLFVKPQERPQSEIDHFPLGFKTGRPKGLAHQIFVNRDVRTH